MVTASGRLSTSYLGGIKPYAQMAFEATKRDFLYDVQNRSSWLHTEMLYLIKESKQSLIVRQGWT